MVEFDERFQIWTLGQGPRARWRCRLDCSDLQEAQQASRTLVQQGEWPSIREIGAFEHNGRRSVGWVTFWWCDSLNEEMEGAPEGRGSGWSDEEDIFVSYEFPGQNAGPWARAKSPGTAVTISQVTRQPMAETVEDEIFIPQPSSPSRNRYVTASCEDCGLIAPMNDLIITERESLSGRSSGARRYSVSRSSGGSYRSGASATSGRSYFKSERPLLCADCHQTEMRKQEQNRPFFDQLISLAFKHLTKRWGR